MQPVCSSGNGGKIQLGSKVEVAKMRIITWYVHFLKCSLHKRAVTLILELNEGNVSTLVNFEDQSTSSKNLRVFEKTNMIFCLLFTK